MDILQRQWISVSQAADIFGVDGQAIYYLINTGRIGALRLGPKSTRVSRVEVESFYTKKRAKD